MRFAFRTIGLWACVAISSFATDPPRPNILVFYVDDMGWGSIGPNGQAARRAQNLPTVKTPNLDRLAAEGVNFTRGYGCHVCSPARSSLMTGFHQGHTFADRNDPDNAKKAIRALDPSIGRSLSNVGYVTGYWGKWGYGGSKDRIPVIDNVQTLPTSHGYRYVLAELHHVRAHTFFQPSLWSAPVKRNRRTPGGMELVLNSMAEYQGAGFPDTPALQNHSEYPQTAYCDDSYAMAALQFVRREAQKYNATRQPFHGLVAVQIPHAPFGEISTLPDWDRAYADDPHFDSLAPQTQQWAAMVTRIDGHFGNILAALEDPNGDGDQSDSVADNTLVVFKSDNGGPGGRSNVEFNANGGLSGTKGKIQEGGIRVPLVMRWPARINARSRLKAGSSSNMVVDVTDLLPTFCELAGANIPLGIDGVSIAPTLSGTGGQRRRDFLIHEAGNGQSIIRGRHKLVRSRRGPLKLFDLEADPAEQTDVADANPKVVKELESLLLGERVTEPKGFANTYHAWKGSDGADTADAANWTDYEYANNGISYLKDDGPPRLSWVARMHNTTNNAQTAIATRDLELLAIEIHGAGAGAAQTLAMKPDVTLTGRNEVRISGHGRLRLDGSSVSTLRWVEIRSTGELAGSGTVEGLVLNDGLVSVSGQPLSSLHVTGGYRQGEAGTLRVPVRSGGDAALRIDGKAVVNGRLEAVSVDDAPVAVGQSVRVLAAETLTGRFSNPNDEVVTSGVRYSIGYSANAVTLTRK